MWHAGLPFRVLCSLKQIVTTAVTAITIDADKATILSAAAVAISSFAPIRYLSGFGGLVHQRTAVAAT